LEIELVIAFVLAAIIVAVCWALTNNPALAVVLGTTVAVVVVAIGDAHRRTIQRNAGRNI